MNKMANFLFPLRNKPGAVLHTSQSIPLVPPLHPEYLLTSSPSSPHCLAYLPSLSQASVVMLYRPLDKPDKAPEGQRSPRSEPEEGRKRRMEEREEEEEAVVKKKGRPGLEECDKVRLWQVKINIIIWVECSNVIAQPCSLSRDPISNSAQQSIKLKIWNTTRLLMRITHPCCNYSLILVMQRIFNNWKTLAINQAAKS